VLFWDYDTQWGADRSRSTGAKEWGALEFENTELLLDELAARGVRACFAVVGAAALAGQRPYHDPRQIRRIHHAGHEIASHSFHHEWLPGLNRLALLKTLQRSKEALEDCVGAPVQSFVPPFNQPFDYPRGWSFSLSERLEAGRERTGLNGLCTSLAETGYRFCRVAYRSVAQRLADAVRGVRYEADARVKTIQKICCVRLNAPCGFGPETTRQLARCVETGGLLAAYAHPHSLSMPGPQNASFLRAFLAEASRLTDQGLLKICTLSELFDLHEAVRSVV
jgi:peptidoglycan/xylan/chitin deacetylase (PgdA/CDA1 family)